MKIKFILSTLILIFATFMACTRDYDAPPLDEPQYTGKPENISIAELKSQYASIVDPTPVDVDYIISGYVTANDISGNIYKQIYIQDETGGINMGVDQNSIYTEYRVGQKVFVHLKGLCMVMYGDQLQIGYNQTNANRIPWEIFNYYTFRDKWANESKVTPRTITLAQLDEDLVNTLVKLENVYFPDGGKLTFSESDATTNRVLLDGNSRSLIVRTSNYANFAADKLPEGGGTLTGILSKFRTDWQFLLREKEDCIHFGQPIPGGDGNEITYYSETFGSDDVSGRPKIGVYTGFDNKQVTYSDISSKADIRTITALPTPHVWFPANDNIYLTIEGINTSTATETLTLSYDLVLNPYNPGEQMNINAMAVSVDGVAMNVPDQVVTIGAGNENRNKVFVINLGGIPAKSGLKVEFKAQMDKNPYGMRLDNIKITNRQATIVIEPK